MLIHFQLDSTLKSQQLILQRIFPCKKIPFTYAQRSGEEGILISKWLRCHILSSRIKCHHYIIKILSPENQMQRRKFLISDQLYGVSFNFIKYLELEILERSLKSTSNGGEFYICSICNAKKTLKDLVLEDSRNSVI